MLDDSNRSLSDSEKVQINKVAQRYRLSFEAVLGLHLALLRGGYKMAQFSHPELGGMGQWSGGMIMIGDLSNSELKQRVQSACVDLTDIFAKGKSATEKEAGRGESNDPNLQAAQESITDLNSRSEGGNNWWPLTLGSASSTGAQNQYSYAYFPVARRLAIKQASCVTIFDTGEHQIFSVSQEQGISHKLTFQSQLGRVEVAQLPVIERYNTEP